MARSPPKGARVMADNEVVVTVTGRDQLSGTLGEAKKNADGFGSSLGKIGEIASGLVLGAGLLKAPGFLFDAAKAAADDEAATARLQTALKNLGGDYDGNLAKVNAAIATGQKLAFSDDDIRDSFQRLAAATGDTDEALTRQKAAMDLARGANIPLADATKLLGKLNADNVEVFKKMGITIGDNATEADALAAVQKKFGGQAETYAKSTAGQFAQAKIAMSEIVESIGGAVLPAFTKIGTALAGALPKVQEFTGTVVSGLVTKLQPTIDAVSAAFVRFGGYVVDTVIPVVRDKLIPAFLDFSEQAKPVIKAVFGAFEDFVAGDVLPKLETAIGLVRDAIEKAAPPTAELAKQIAEKLFPPLKDLINFVADHKEILAALGIAIATVVTPSIIAWTVATIAQTTATMALAVANVIAYAPVIAITAAIALLVLGIIEAVKHWDAIKAKVQEFADKISGWIEDHKALAAGILLLTGPIGLVIGAGALLITHWDEVKAKAGELKDWVVEKWNALKDGAIEKAQALIDWVTGLPMAIKGAIGDLSMLLWDLGTQALEGLWNGMKNKWNDVSGWVTDVPGKILGIFQKGLQINSPSKVMIPIGEGVMEGIQNGMESVYDQKLTPFLNSVDQAISIWGDGVLADMTDTFKQALAISASIADQNATLTGTAAANASIVAHGGSPVLADGSIAAPGTPAYAGFEAMNAGAPSVPVVTGNAAQDLTQAQKDYIDRMNATPMASGGVVRARPGGLLALLGEGGRDEAVIPLGSGGGGGGNTYNITVHLSAPNYIGPEQALADPIKRVLMQFERTGVMTPVMR